MAISGTKSMSALTKELGVNEKTPESWTADSKRELGIADTARLREAQPKPDPELVAARKIIAELKKENDFFDRLQPCFAKRFQWFSWTNAWPRGGASTTRA